MDKVAEFLANWLIVLFIMCPVVLGLVVFILLVVIMYNEFDENNPNQFMFRFGLLFFGVSIIIASIKTFAFWA